MGMRFRLVGFGRVAAAMALAVALLPAAGSGIASADLGNCVLNPSITNAHQMGIEADSGIWGVRARVLVRNPDLCNGTQGPAGSGSTAYVMVWKPSSLPFDYWLQTGYVKIPGTSAHWYQQYSTGNTVVSDDIVCSLQDPCVNATIGSRYRTIIQHKVPTGENFWHSTILLDSSGATVWTGTDVDASTLGFSPTYLEYASETLDVHDQSGGGNASRMAMDNMQWYSTSALTLKTPDIQGSERVCDLCGSAGPYNYNWTSGHSYEVRTDGF